MSSIRTRLAWRFAGLVLVAVTAFAVATFVARRAAAFGELERSAALRGDLALLIVGRAGASNIQRGPGGSEVTGPARGALEGIPGYLVVYDQSGEQIFRSQLVRRLSDFLQGAEIIAFARADLESFNGALRRSIETKVPVEFTLRNDRGLLVRREDATGFRVIVGVSQNEMPSLWRETLGSTIVVFPIVLLLAVGGAYALARDVLAPVDRIRQEVEAITDGRSLHRRVAIESRDDEMARLTGTLNDMIGRLETSFAGLRRFTADASHELKTPLAVLRADIERAMSAAPQSTEQLIALEEALQQTTRMGDLVDSLLTLARADEGRFDLFREPVPLEPLVREVLETALILAEPAELNVTMPELEPLTVLGDRTRLRQLFLNLVTNAIKYTNPGGEVEISLRRVDGSAQFSVRDSGIGIAAADLPYIFERFWRADRVRSRKSERGGFGLGLAISQWIAQAHGGQLLVQSRLHRGTTFTAVIPLPEQLPTA